MWAFAGVGGQLPARSLKSFVQRSFRRTVDLLRRAGSEIAEAEGGRTVPMLQLAARQLASLRLPLDRLVGVSTVVAFFWLLLQDRIHPVAIYLLELYLSL